MKNLKIKEINFLIGDTRGLTKSYPSSGLFISRLEGGISDFILVNKDVEFVFFICPEETFNYIFKGEEKTVISEPNNDTYKEDFILEFSRILLNRK
jgi:hypothetical protein